MPCRCYPEESFRYGLDEPLSEIRQRVCCELAELAKTIPNWETKVSDIVIKWIYYHELDDFRYKGTSPTREELIEAENYTLNKIKDAIRKRNKYHET